MATITEKGKLVALTDQKSGVSNSGKPWNSCVAVFEIPNVYGSIRRLALRCVNDRCQDVSELEIGAAVELNYIVSSNEWQGRWFTNAELCSVKAEAKPQAQAQAPQPEAKQGDLPF